jgi:DNA mismatch repair protein MutL
MAEKNIIILSDDLVNKIAAGEVVERPASVVKELVENSLDAGAKNILVEIQSGGVKLMRVLDDGSGMSAEDAQVALSRHATSKIKSVDDLYQIETLGFRGEALPSIASVSFLELVTKTRESLAGTLIKVEGGKIKEKKETGAPQGTSLTVRELFYNTPARRKFLKSKITETKHIIDLVTAYALAYPEISFRLRSDNRELFNLKKREYLFQRIEDLWGKDFLSSLVQIKAETQDPQFTGFVGKPEIAKSNRAEIHLFVNSRPVFSRFLNHSIRTGYGELLPQGKFPVAFVFIQIDPQKIDVNVHPAKREIKFSQERQIYNLVHLSVKKSLGTLKTTPTLTQMNEVVGTSEKETGQRIRAKDSMKFTGKKDDLPTQREIKEFDRKEKEFTPQQEKILSEIYSEHSLRKDEKLKQKEVHPSEIFVEKKNFWQVFDSYIITQGEDELIIIDQHAAHERILYEEANANLTRSKATSQQLLFPSVVELSPSEYFLLDNNLSLFAKLGFEIKPFGGKSVMIHAVPSLLKNKSESLFLKEVLVDFEEKLKTETEDSDPSYRIKSIAQSFACTVAIKAGERLKPDDMSGLYKRLLTTQNPFSCPHGRPTLIRFPLKELDKRFKKK